MCEKFVYGWVVMGSFIKGKGEVFIFGCIDWVYGLMDVFVV